MPFDPLTDANPQYSPAGVPTLSEAARALDVPTLNDLALLAEQLLGLRGTALTGANGRTAKLAVGMQVSFMIEQGVASRLYSDLTEGERRYKFAEAAEPGVDPVAARLVAPLLAPVLPPAAPVTPTVVKTF